MSEKASHFDKLAGEYTFNGGIRLREFNKISCDSAIVSMPLSNRYVVPLQQHIGATLQPAVTLGETVLKGQLLAASEAKLASTIHAPTSGTITAIDERAVPHPSGLKDLCIELTSDGEDRWIELKPVGGQYRDQSPQILMALLEESGIVGLGGAVYPTSAKMQTVENSADKIGTLIINAAECEPWISCDQALMQEKSDDILRGIDVALHISGANSCLVGIEDNKPEAINAMEMAAKNSSLPVSVITIPTIYPTGGERQLIKVLTNREVPADGYPADNGMLVLNVATAWSLQNFIIHGKPLISRIVTVTGSGIKAPCNVEARIGTTMSNLIEQSGGYTENVRQLTMGGPMMGFALPSDELPVVKATNCLLAETDATLTRKPDAMACIRCGACAEACPADLLPQQLYWYSRAKNLEALKTYSLKNCIECGCCDYVCPSHIPLVHYFRFSKTETRNAEAEQKKANIARIRHEARDTRLERIKKEKAEKLAAKKAALEAKKKNQPDDKKAAIADALERAKKRKEELKNKQTDNSSDEKTAKTENIDPSSDQAGV